MSKGNKYYAIKKGRGIENKIVRSWSECKKIVEGYNSEFKAFKVEEEALEYLGITKKSKVTKNRAGSKKDVADTVKNKNDNDIVNLRVENKSNKSSNFKVQISDELYNDFIRKCSEKHLSKDLILAFIMNGWTYGEEEIHF